MFIMGFNFKLEVYFENLLKPINSSRKLNLLTEDDQ